MLKIKEIRKEKGMSQLDVAKAIGVSVQTISGYETNYAFPTAERLVKLADFLGCTTDELLGRENYGRGIVEITGEQLTVDEREMLSVFRKLSAKEKRRAIEIVQTLTK